MTHQEKIEAIRKACAKANPEIIVEGCESGISPCACWWHKNYPPDGNKFRPIRLADVLLAIDDKSSRERYTVDCLGGFKKVGTKWIICNWNLRKDSLEEQSEETVAFIYDLLR